METAVIKPINDDLSDVLGVYIPPTSISTRLDELDQMGRFDNKALLAITKVLLNHVLSLEQRILEKENHL